MGLSVADVAQRIKLHRRQLESIERGDWAALPGMAFARGSVRSYARLVGVDPTALLKEMGGYESLDSLQEKPSLGTPMPRAGDLNFGGSRRFRRLPWALLGLAGVIVLAWLVGRPDWGFPWGGAATTVSGAQAPANVPATGGGSAPGSTPAATSEPAANAPAISSVPSTSPPSVAPATAAQDAPAPSDTAARGSGAGLRLSVRQDAWVEIRDPAGRILHMGTVKPGAPLDLAGAGPFVYTIGNASQTDLSFGGRPVDLKPLTVMPANIAKGRLP